jgi:carboxyl-terminal processing protease
VSFYLYLRSFILNQKYIALISISLLSLSSVFAQPTPKPTASPIATEANTVTSEKIERDMAEAITLIQDKYVGGKSLNYNELFKSSIEGMLHTLDPHSSYFDAKAAEEFRTEQSSQYFGIGATIGDVNENGVISTYIKATFENAPANRGGLRYGDRILEVNGTSMKGKQFAEVRTFLRGPRGTVAKITFQRYGSTTPQTVEIIRDAVAQPSIPEAYLIRPGIGYIAMTGGFNQTTGDEFQVALASLKKQGMESLVIDLRGNPGGLVRESLRIANTFLEEGQIILTQKGRSRVRAESYRSDNTNPDKTPIVLLVNGNSASASEILSGALQDQDRALVVGETTFGKALVTNPFPLDYGSMVLLTIAKYQTPSGRILQRDYSNGGIYDYYNNSSDENSKKPKGIESKTASGRSIYGGNGIEPDEVVKPQTITREKALSQIKLTDSIVAFGFELSFGKATGFESYKVDRESKFNHDILPNEFVVTDSVFDAYKKFATTRFKQSPTLIEKEKAYIQRVLRTELVTAAYGSQTSFQVTNEFDNQLLRSIELLPKAKALAIAGAKANSEKASRSNR